ncbi:GNAT family N-acetyltransferase [Flindersiella endophytica]
MSTSARIREYRDDDEDSWLRCRLLSFFRTQYYDDVVTERPRFDRPSIRLVAEAGSGCVAGLVDVEIFGAEATIDVLAVHPDHQRQGIASALLAAATAELDDREVGTLDAWTREDPEANQWYQNGGFTEKFRYVHIHKTAQDSADGFETPDGMSHPIHAFLQAPIELEQAMRARFRRVYVCRQYVKRLRGQDR